MQWQIKSTCRGKFQRVMSNPLKTRLHFTSGFGKKCTWSMCNLTLNLPLFNSLDLPRDGEAGFCTRFEVGGNSLKQASSKNFLNMNALKLNLGHFWRYITCTFQATTSLNISDYKVIKLCSPVVQDSHTVGWYGIKYLGQSHGGPTCTCQEIKQRVIIASWNVVLSFAESLSKCPLLLTSLHFGTASLQ